MTKKLSTKNSLIASLLILALCVSMLIGTTFAWFTDKETSANNIIKSGNLDVELYYQANGQSNWSKVTEATNVFMENALWEPGHTEIVKLKVVNAGSLALNYQLSVNVAKEIGSVNQEGKEFKLSEFIRFGFVEGEHNYTREEAIAAIDATSTPLSTPYNTDVISLEPSNDTDSDERTVTMVVYMPKSVGNKANYKKDAEVPTINLGLNLFATQRTSESDGFGDQYDKDAIIVKTALEAQDAINNAAPGTMIKLAPGVNYGTLVFGQKNDMKVVDISNLGGDAAGNEKYSSYKDITIIGEGAIVDGIDFKTGWIAGFGASYVDIKNLTVIGVTFSGNATAFNIDGAHGGSLGIDGLTVKGCKMTDDGNSRLIFQQITGYKDLFDKSTSEYVMTTGVKNLTVEDCEIEGAYQVIESRAMENITVKNNTFTGIKARDLLIAYDSTNHPGIFYTGTITITGNRSVLGEERFVRMNGSGDANVIIKDNVITDYLGADDDYIKVTLNNVAPVIENNTMTRAYRASNADELKVALTSAADGENIYLAAADFGGVGLYNTTNNGHRYEYANYQTKNINIIGQNGTTFSNLRLGENDTADVVMTGWTFKNIGFTGDGLIISMNNKDVTVENCRFTNTELMNTGTSTYQAVNFTVKNCIFDGSHATRKTQLALQNNDGVTITGCTFNNAAYNAMNITEIHGNVTIDGNTINGTADRPFRFVIADPSATLIIKNNTVVSGGNSEGQLVKADGTVTVGNITLDGNTWNGKSDSEVTAGMVGSDYIVK